MNNFSGRIMKIKLLEFHFSFFHSESQNRPSSLKITGQAKKNNIAPIKILGSWNHVAYKNGGKT